MYKAINYQSSNLEDLVFSPEVEKVLSGSSLVNNGLKCSRLHNLFLFLDFKMIVEMLATFNALVTNAKSRAENKTRNVRRPVSRLKVS